jgi:hypothetical protein
MRPIIGLIYQPWMIDGDDCGSISGVSGKENGSTRRKTYLNAASSTTNPT